MCRRPVSSRAARMTLKERCAVSLVVCWMELLHLVSSVMVWNVIFRQVPRLLGEILNYDLFFFFLLCRLLKHFLFAWNIFWAFKKSDKCVKSLVYYRDAPIVKFAASTYRLFTHPSPILHYLKGQFLFLKVTASKSLWAPWHFLLK